jgi:predicted O-methyltransferase YrrM
VQPKRILDLGSGLSSAVFRKWAAERDVNCDIVSVDTDAAWLDKTREFLKVNELSTDGLTTWPIRVEPESFDLVFHDLAGGGLREQVAPIAAAAVRRGGVVVFDDAQHDGHLTAYEEASTAYGIELYSLAKWTFDAIERWAVIGFKDGEPLIGTSLAELHTVNCSTPSDINEHLPKLKALAEHADHVVELGARTGLSTVAWLMGLRKSGGRLTSVDLSPAPDIGEHDNWHHIQGDDTAADVMAQVDECDVLFIDTSHAYEHTLWELRNWSAKVKPGGLIVCHDTELQRPWDPPCPPTDPDFPVASAINEFCAETGYRWMNFPGCWGLGIIKLEAQ